MERERRAESRATAELVQDLAAHTQALVKKHVELAELELRADVRRELRAAKGLAGAGLLALQALNLLLVTAALALGAVIPAWLAALILSLALLAAGAGLGLWSWSRRVRRPLSATQRTLAESLQWPPKHLA